MFVLIWGILLSSGASVWAKQDCAKGTFCTTLSEADRTAEAGLCVVIPCSFTTATTFTPQHIVWFKCKPSKPKCDDSDMIFHTNKHNTKVQSLFKGRVSLLQPAVSQGNCSIIINDLTESDSGKYKLRVNGLVGEKVDGYTYPERAVPLCKSSSVTCEVSFRNIITAEETVTLNVTLRGFLYPPSNGRYHNYTTVECVSRNDIGGSKRKPPCYEKKWSNKTKGTCQRKQKNSEEIAGTLEMISAGEAVQNDGTQRRRGS
ncbi:hypothetical protein KUCAC02_014174 [Chaenocephalus aceratus]|uniref:Uncharacterized protein n=1 Tax=Chaenocephalus aceratus TaxID=36190 RepID=A0ACB9WEJ5_CHAAC|nr:hypothetical protein KUCAC02_014174 [Chaenocephalus aceratus]